MTDAELREKVVQGLELCLKGLSDLCPYKDSDAPGGCRDELMYDVMMLLKAQEPRVMTLSRVQNLKESIPVWLEDVDKKDVIGALFMRDYSGTRCVDFAIVRDWEFKRVVADYIDYGIRWRCWDKEPTDEQRKETPWTQTNGL